MATALIPGSYDPITIGHLDIITRASNKYDKVIVLIAQNSNKTYTLSPENRLTLAKDAVKHLKNVTCDMFDGYIVDYIANIDKSITIVKGLRNATDFDYEKEMAIYNKELSERKYGFSVETVFFLSNSNYSNISSSLVKTLIGSSKEYSNNCGSKSEFISM